MTLAQQLYEGIEIGAEGATGLITYMRTDSPRISNEATADAREVIQSRFGADYLPGTPNVYKTSKAAQEAHESHQADFGGTRPRIDPSIPGSRSVQSLQVDLNRFIASQMVPAILDVTRIDSTPVGTSKTISFARPEPS